LGALTGVMGSLQALEAIKEILQMGESMAGRLMLYDGLSAVFRTVKLKPDPACALCGAKATIRDLSHHEAPAAACTP
jgi:adenylyltransferase/sulfurtransferase